MGHIACHQGEPWECNLIDKLKEWLCDKLLLKSQIDSWALKPIAKTKYQGVVQKIKKVDWTDEVPNAFSLFQKWNLRYSLLHPSHCVYKNPNREDYTQVIDELSVVT